MKVERSRAIGSIAYLVLNACYKNIRQDSTVMSCAVLMASGIRADGRRTLLGVDVLLSETEIHWCLFLHLQRNASAHVPKMDMRPQVAENIRVIFNAPDRQEG